MFDYVREKWILSSINYEDPDFKDLQALEFNRKFKKRGKLSKKEIMQTSTYSAFKEAKP